MDTDLKRLLPLLLLVALPSLAQAQFSFTVTSNTVTITRYVGGAGQVDIPNTILDLPVIAIGDGAFSACANVTGVTIPANVTSIGVSAFASCTGLAGISIPAGVTNIGSTAFGFCSRLAAITVAPSNPIFSSVGGVVFSNAQRTLFEYPPGRVGDYVVPGSVTNIGDYAFYSCGGLPSVTIPGSVTNVGYSAFRLCSSLTNFAMASGVTNIGSLAFADCIGLTDITIPGSVTNMGSYAFANCTNLTNAYFMGNAPSAGPTVFSGDSNATVYYWSTNSGWGSIFGGRPAIPRNLVILSQPPPNLYFCPGGSFSMGVAANGKAPIGYQWRRNGTNLTDTLTLLGSTNTVLTLSNITELDLGQYDVVITNCVGSTSSVPATVALSSAPAHATAMVVNGFIVGATLVDGGCGYTNSPILTFVSASGKGATGYGQVYNGVVTNIVITSAGQGYAANTVLMVGPPTYPLLILDLPVLTLPSATATSLITNGFIIGAIVTDPGTGYYAQPVISFNDATGHGAGAMAQFSNGGITALVITNAGSGYSTNVTTSIAPPPDVQAFILNATGLIPGQMYQMQQATNMTSWLPLGAPFSPTQSSVGLITNFWNTVTNSKSTYYRLRLNP